MVPTLSSPSPTTSPLPVVNSFNEWDPLEEAIVGVAEGASELPWDLALEAVMPADAVDDLRRYHQKLGGKPKPPKQTLAAARELDELVHVLEAEGVTVRRPDPIDHARRFATPDWESP